MSPTGRSRVLLVGGGSGFVGRAVVRELIEDHEIRSAHRTFSPAERDVGVEWVPTDLGASTDWGPRLEGVDAVVNVAWHRAGPASRFRPLCEGLEQMLAACRGAGIDRIVHVSVPEAPPHLESTLPYLIYKRRFDRAIEQSGLAYAILRPSALFGPGDKLLGVMMRSIHRYPFFPMFGDGAYRISPIAVADLARAVRVLLASAQRGTFEMGGPVVYSYRALTDLMYENLGKRPRYWRLSERNSLRLAAFLETAGSSLLYRYEVEWLLSGRLGLPPARLVDGPLARVEPYLSAMAARLRGGRSALAAGPGQGR